MKELKRISTEHVGNKKDGKLGIEGASEVSLKAPKLLNSPCSAVRAHCRWIFITFRRCHLTQFQNQNENPKWRFYWLRIVTTCVTRELSLSLTNWLRSLHGARIIIVTLLHRPTTRIVILTSFIYSIYLSLFLRLHSNASFEILWWNQNYENLDNLTSKR